MYHMLCTIFCTVFHVPCLLGHTYHLYINACLALFLDYKENT